MNTATTLLKSLRELDLPAPAPIHTALVTVLRRIWDSRHDRFQAPDARGARHDFVDLVQAICHDFSKSGRCASADEARLTFQMSLR